MTEPEALPVRPVSLLVRGPIVEVWRGEDASGQPTRLEIVRRELSDTEEISARVRQALDELRRLGPAGAVAYLNAGTLADGRLCATTARLEGVTLDARLRTTGPMEPLPLLDFAAALCKVIDGLRLAGVVHGAIGPWSVVLTAQGPTLAMFGAARLTGRDAPREACSILTSLPYASPELRDGGAAGFDADLYAVAAVLFEALTGLAPDAYDDPRSTLSVYLETVPTDARRLPGAIGRTLLRALAANPTDRFASGAELAHAMRVATDHPTIEETMLSGAALPALRAPVREEKVGDVFGNYELLALLGEGGMGRVFKARHTRLGRLVALKLLKPEHAQHRGLVQRFFDEARAVNQISHEHIVDIHDFVEDDSVSPPRVYCVMELLSGESLADRMMRAPIRVAEAVDIVRKVCSALQAAHTVGVYHRDIKPDNIFLAERGERHDFVKVLDFGVAKLAPSLSGPRGATVAGTIVGTPAYMSPEQASGYEIDGRSDLYTVGVVLYQLLTGRLPFDGDTFLSLAVQITTVEPPAIGPATPSGEPIPPKLAAVVMGCLSKEPSNRPVSMTELSNLLAPFATPEAPKFPWSIPPTLSEDVPASVDPLSSIPPPVPTASDIPPPPVPGFTPPERGAAQADETPKGAQSLEVSELGPEELDVLPRRNPRAIALALVVFLAGGGAAFWFVARSAELPTGADTAVETTSRSAAAPVAAVPDPAPVAPTGPVEVELRVVSRPPGADVLRRDTGEKLGTTPLDLALERETGSPLPLRIELTGYAPLETQLPRDEDRVLEVVLTEQPKPKARQPAKPQKSRTPARAMPELNRDGVLDAYEE